MINLPKVLQGTDGIRGRVAEDEILQGQNPLAVYMDSGFLTPAFFERYTYAFGCLLISSGLADTRNRVVVGWDPRDEAGNFNQAAMSGLLKAGLDVVKIGVLPTPAIPLYMIYSGAIGSVVLTASHNPSDQNGIKLFTGFTGLKFLPIDDEKLTSTINEQQEIDIQSMPELGQMVDESKNANELFVSYHRDPANSWINDEEFSDTILFIDASKGATSGVVEEIFSSYKFREVFFTNMKGAINENCGVADIEGNERISASDVLEKNAKFGNYETLRLMFSTAESTKEVQSGEIKLTALVFDGDGDRCFRLDYDPGTTELIVSSGDILGIHQARFLLQKHGSDINNGIFVNTVESDLKTAISAGQLGYISAITGVGDKWILLKAVTDKLRAEADADIDTGPAVLDYLDKIDQGSGVSALHLSTKWKKYLNASKIVTAPPYQFQLGIEESGHSISPGFITVGQESIRCFAGNGIKSGLNSLISASRNLSDFSGADWFANLAQPYAPGVKETFYIYYVVKSRLLSKSEFRKDLQIFLNTEFRSIFPTHYQSEVVYFPEEDSMIYCQITLDGAAVGAVFVRNSGTEDKSALYLRGEPDLSAFLHTLGEKVHLYLLNNLKDRTSRFTDFQINFLKAIAAGDSAEDYLSNYADIPVDRIIKEIELKERLIINSGGRVQLTEKGKRFIEQW